MYLLGKGGALRLGEREDEEDDGWFATCSEEEELQAKPNEDMIYRSDLKRKKVLDSRLDCEHIGEVVCRLLEITREP